ncbi:MAG TPA: hypothetical protein VGQ59_19405 [Cyclobacteriaceae bacterium]|nr:hypothetical protein [Cyclobacteriaceae bacterium]
MNVEPDFEYVNPLKHLEKSTIQLYHQILLDGYYLKRVVTPILKRILLGEAEEKWKRKLKEITSIEVPEWMKKLLTTQSKNEQEKLLKGISINPDQLVAFILHAGEQGFTYSQYSAENHFKGLDVGEMPTIVHIQDDGSVEKVGKTNLTDGQLKQALTQRKVMIAKFFDKGSEWHCLFTTFNSLGGKENWKDGQPHYHYISDKFGLKREEVVARLKSKEGMSTSIHIPLLDYKL